MLDEGQRTPNLYSTLRRTLTIQPAAAKGRGNNSRVCVETASSKPPTWASRPLQSTKAVLGSARSRKGASGLGCCFVGPLAGALEWALVSTLLLQWGATVADEWHYFHEGNQKGPVSGQMLKNLADAGDLLPTDLVWKEGLAEWQSASKVKGLFPDKPAKKLPPPLPTTQPPRQSPTIASPPAPHGAGTGPATAKGLFDHAKAVAKDLGAKVQAATKQHVATTQQPATQRPQVAASPPPDQIKRIPCPHCQSSLEDDGTLGGQLVACPHCGKQFQMPHKDADASPFPSIIVTPPGVGRSSGRKWKKGLLFGGAGCLTILVLCAGLFAGIERMGGLGAAARRGVPGGLTDLLPGSGGSLNGTWMNRHFLTPVKWQFGDDEITVIDLQNEMQSTYKIEFIASSPKRMVWTKDGTSRLRGIYECDGRRLKICYVWHTSEHANDKWLDEGFPRDFYKDSSVGHGILYDEWTKVGND